MSTPRTMPTQPIREVASYEHRALSMLIWNAQDLQPWLLGGPVPVEFSAYGEHSMLVLDLASASDFSQIDALAAWLRRLACPVIGVRDAMSGLCRQPEASACAEACDVVVEVAEDAQWLCERITANPIAAYSFVELLRASETASIAHGLAMESAVYATLQGGAEYAAWLADQAPRPPQVDETGPAVVQERDGAVLSLTLNRPANRNAMSMEIRDALLESLRLVLMDESIRALHLYGRGRNFSTGGDLSEFGAVPDAASGHLIRALTVPGKFLAELARRQVQTVAHVHGACVGSGIEFPAFAGRIEAQKNSWFQLPEVSMGLIPGAGGCISMARRIGRQRLAWMGLSGKRIRAPQALAWGLIDEIV